ncbi:MAG: electron transfer flavoprotein subunit alpha/FixB family protein [Gammaproteobacteria bacterium]|nr:electron transfer flavoprotein subunit alpha/FixB family protein [Gammaproteobacteria bacterium]
MRTVADSSGIMVVVETADGRPVDLAFEMLGLARRLADGLGGAVTAAALGAGLDGIGEVLVAGGADRVLIVDDAAFADYQADAWLPDLAGIVTDAAPAAVLIGHTVSGADLAPRLAFRLDTAVATGCEAVDIVNGRPHMTRACFGGNAREVVSFTTVPAVATIRAKTQEALEPDPGRTGDIEFMAPILDAGSVRTRIIGRERESARGVRLENADVVVAGGRGVGGPEGFGPLDELARLLGGAVGASRVACDLGWCPPSYQIGLTGRTVAPELYLAVGISGAGQHMAGCGAAKTIVSINSDPDAAIFRSSRFGVVGNCQEVIPALVEEIRKLKA